MAPPDDVLPLTTARARLFDLVDDLLSGRRVRVELSHRGDAERVVLVRKSELAGLEADLAALRARVGPEPRPLRGLGTLNVDADDVLLRGRARQAKKVAEKRASFGTPTAGGGQE